MLQAQGRPKSPLGRPFSRFALFLISSSIQNNDTYQDQTRSS